MSTARARKPCYKLTTIPEFHLHQSLAMGFVAYNTQHNCYVFDALASPLQTLYRSIAFPSQICQDPTSVSRLAEWRVIEIIEWHSSRSETYLRGPYLSVDLASTCGCRQSVQVRVDAYGEQFVFMDGVGIPFPIQDAFYSEEDWSSEEDTSMSFSISTSDWLESDDGMVSSPPLSSPPSSRPSTPSESGCAPPLADSFISNFQFPIPSKCFSLVDLALLLSAVQEEHADHRWSDLDRSALMPFTSAEVFVFLDYFLEVDWRNQVVEYRRAIAKRFFDKRVVVWNTWRPAFTDKWIGEGEPSLAYSNPPKVGDSDDGERENPMWMLDHERRLLSCMKDRVSFVNDELRLLWMSLAAQKCALQASESYVDEEPAA